MKSAATYRPGRTSMRYRFRVYAAAVTAAFLTSSVTGHAQQSSQSTTGTNEASQTKPAAPPAYALPNSGTGENQGYLFNLRPMGLQLGKQLSDYGVYITGRTLQQAITETGGGIKRGTFYEGFNQLGLDLDMNKIANIKGGSFHLLFNDLTGLPYQTYSGSSYVFNRAFAVSAAARLNEFSYEQVLFDSRLDLRVGRVPTGLDFDSSPTYCEFIYGLCALTAGFTFDKGAPAYLTASTAGIAKVDLGHNYYFNVAAFEDEPALAKVGHTNLPGSDWDPSLARGVTIPAQFGYKTTFATDPYPKSFDVGGYFDTGDYSDSFANTTGRNRLLYGGTAKVDHGRSGVWLQAEQVVYRPDPSSRRALTLFAEANFLTTGNANITNAYFGGFSYKGPFAERPNDSLNFVGHVLHLNNAYTANVDTNLALRGISGTVSGTEAYVEINYGFAIAPGMTLKPSYTYIWNPDQVGIAKPVVTNRTAQFFGVAFSALIPDALGLPRL